MKNKNVIAKNMLRKFFMIELLFSAILLIIFFGSWLILANFTWYGDEPIYNFLYLINLNPLFFLMIAWFIGAIIIATYFYIKVLNYIGLIAQSSELVSKRSSDLIVLPTDLKEIELMLNQIKSEAINNENLAKEAEKRKNDLVIYLAHDLKTPLTSIIGYFSLLNDEKVISDEVRDKYINIALNKSYRLEDLINEFFDITRFNLSSISLKYTSVSLKRMIEQLMFEFKPVFREKNLDYSIIGDEINLLCDVDKIQRVFDNMIRNALNYSYDNTIITVSLIEEEKYVKIIFENKGATLSQEMLERIFEQFYRIDDSRTSRTGGSGLGLAISKEIIEAHNGKIEASSDNEMISFTISLPRL